MLRREPVAGRATGEPPQQPTAARACAPTRVRRGARPAPRRSTCSAASSSPSASASGTPSDFRRAIREQPVALRAQVHAVCCPQLEVADRRVGFEVEQHGAGRRRDQPQLRRVRGEPPREETRDAAPRQERGHQQHIAACGAKATDAVRQRLCEAMRIGIPLDEVVRADEHRHEVGAQLECPRNLLARRRARTRRLRTARFA